LYLGCFPQRSTASRAALPAMSLTQSLHSLGFGEPGMDRCSIMVRDSVLQLLLQFVRCTKVSYMRETLTISLPKRLRRDLEKMAKAEGVTSSEYVRRAIKADLFRRALRAARRELVPQARTRGIYTDEDVFKIVS